MVHKVRFVLMIIFLYTVTQVTVVKLGVAL